MLSNCGPRESLKSPFDCKEIQPVSPKGNQPWIFIGRTDAEAEAPILWPPDAKNWLIGKDPKTGKDWRQEKETTEDEMVGWHRWLNGHEFAQTLEIVKDRAAWRAAVHGATKSWTWVSDWTRTSPVAQLVKNPPTMREIWVRSLGWEDPLEKGKAAHSSILAWRFPWTV